MSIEKGSAFLLKVGNGDVPLTYTTIAGLRTTQLSVSGEAVNITSKDFGRLAGAAVRRGRALGQRIGRRHLHRFGGRGENPHPCAVGRDRRL